MAKSVQISYFAIFREQRGLSKECYDTDANTLGELYAELKSRHNFSLSAESLRVARNNEFATWNEELRANDEVAFIPPVAGG